MARMLIAVLRPGDEAALEAFLAPHAESSMFLRGNVASSGLVDHGEVLQGTYVAAREGDSVVAVVGQAWNGMLMLQAPVCLSELVTAVLKETGRALTGLTGPWQQVEAARDALGIRDLPMRVVSKERLMALALADMMIPQPPAAGQVTVRAAVPADEDAMIDMRLAYMIETLGDEDSLKVRGGAAEGVQRAIERGLLYVAEVDGEPVATTAFNAVLPDIVQIGGVYTPPPLRNRGYARAAVAGSLLAVREGGVQRAILFTADSGHAWRAYAGIGFRTIGDFGMVLLAVH